MAPEKMAETLDDAFRNFKPEPLMRLEEFKQFYVERPESAHSPVPQIYSALRVSESASKFLFLGFRGSGKSTELYKLKARLEGDKEFFPVMFSIKEDMDINDFDIRDFLVFLGIKVADAAEGAGIKVPQEAKEKFVNFLGEIINEKEITKSTTVGTGIDVFGFIKSKIGIEAKTRQILRQNLDTRISDLLLLLNNLLLDIQRESGKQIVIIVDDLDKLTRREQAERFFFGNYNLLVQIHAHIIYTVPISLAYSPEYQSFRGAFTDEFRIRHVPPTTKSGKIWKEGFDFYKSVVEKRMNLDLISDEALEKAILSTGKLSEFIQVIRSSCLYAISRNGERINLDDVNRALQKLRDSYDRTLTSRHLEVLKLVYTKKEAREQEPSDSIIRDLLFSLMIVEYSIGDERWEDVNLLLVPLIKRMG